MCLYLTPPIKGFENTIYDNAITDGNIVSYDDYPSYDENYNEYEVVLWDLNYDIELCEWILRIQINN